MLKMSNKKISCIIPAYNEQDRIERVLKAVHNHPLIDEIIVINDGSTDRTAEIISKFSGLNVITNDKNLGKSATMAIGISQAQHDYLLLVDADLINITSDNITSLIKPVIDGVADMSMTLRKNSPRHWHTLGLDYISGERLVPKDLLADKVETIKCLPHYGIEVFMNQFIIQNKYRLAIVKWPNVVAPFKIRKIGYIKGSWGEVRMSWQLIKTVGPFCIINQIYLMRNLIVKDQGQRK